MSKWFRWYSGTCEDIKFRVTARNAHVTVATVMGVWAVILEDASHDDHRGIGVRDRQFYSTILDIGLDDLENILAHMISVDLIEINDDGIRVIHWNERQFETDASDGTGAERQRRFREKQKANASKTAGNANRNGAVTVTKRPETETETETDKKDIRAPALVFETDWPKDYRDVFWQIYPRRQDKQAAFKKLDQIRRSGTVPWEAFLAGVRRYADSVRGKDPQYTKGPAAWLNAGKWEDEIVTKSSVFYSNKMEGIL